MFLNIYKAELYKIIKSYGFKIAFLGVICFSIYNITNEYIEFKNYDIYNKDVKKQYQINFESDKNELYNLKKHPNRINNFKEREKVNRLLEHNIEFYKKHKVPCELKKDFSQGISKCIFDYKTYLSLILLFCCASVCYEKTRNITQIQFASVNRNLLYFSKYFSMISAAIIIFFSNILFSYIFSGFLMGFSDLSGPIQSVREYSNFATSEISIRSMITLKIIFGILSIVTGIANFLLVSILINDVITSYIISALLITNSAIFYLNGCEYSIFAIFELYDVYIYRNFMIDIKAFLLSVFFQTIVIYLIGLYFYKKLE